MHSFPFFHLFSASFLTEISRAECSAALTHTSSCRRCEDTAREEEGGGGRAEQVGLDFCRLTFFRVNADMRSEVKSDCAD